MVAKRGPRLKAIRRLGTPLPGLTRKNAEKKPYPPGQHGPTGGGSGRGRRKQSEYGRQLLEKQKLRLNYGISERQMRNYMAMANKQGGKTGEALLALLERRLDNVVFRLGLAATIPAARQLVAHGHIRVDGRRVDRPAFLVNVGQHISVSDRARKMVEVASSVEHGPQVRLPGYLAIDPTDKLGGRMISLPMRSDVPLIVDDAAVVEFYAR
ncbi:30S ribosomal protein S4 [Longimicrobium sp.]|uniref:30S ribosomal protein S4 n=1 Tax=Longimicrobium sp. TaxID=2029185 RepID=UPI002C31340C|nr:30S ribosomal protein S4 [Longimicrobium sp.]HSU14792.1 30S ribosomal protein S4 [Longimicrobium sp.]